jgi:hypothetical protein
LPIHSTPQQQAAPAHVTATDKVGRESQPVMKTRQQNVHVLGSGNAAEQNNLGALRQLLCQALRVALNR